MGLVFNVVDVLPQRLRYYGCVPCNDALIGDKMSKRIYELNKAEVALAWDLAKQRYAANRKNNVQDRLVTSKDPIENEADATGAEIALAAMTGGEMDKRNYPCKKGADIIIKGVKVDVKQADEEYKNLLVSLWQKNTAIDVYVLMIGKLPVFEFKGAATKQFVFEDRWLTKRNGKEYQLVPKRELFSLRGCINEVIKGN